MGNPISELIANKCALCETHEILHPMQEIIKTIKQEHNINPDKNDYLCD